eukprot:11537711-Prorocentrum_lima.AAC.1
MRAHRHGKNNSQRALSADLSGPHPKGVGTGYSYLLVAVVHTTLCERASKQDCKRSSRSSPLC